MKIAPVILATALAAVVGAVQPTFAQPYDSSDSSGSNAGNHYGSEQETNTPAHPNEQWNRDRDWHSGEGSEGEGMRHRDWMMHHRRMMMMMMGRRGHEMGGRQEENRGARFRFARGNARIDIQCPPDQDVQDCVRAASKLIDKVATMGEHHPPVAPPKPGANPPPPPPPHGGPPGGTNGSGQQGGNHDSGPGHMPPRFDNRT